MLCYITVLIHVEVECSYKNSRKVGLLLLGQKSTHFIAISYGTIWLKAFFQVAYNDVCTREVASQMMVLDLQNRESGAHLEPGVQLHFFCPKGQANVNFWGTCF